MQVIYNMVKASTARDQLVYNYGDLKNVD